MRRCTRTTCWRPGGGMSRRGRTAAGVDHGDGDFTISAPDGVKTLSVGGINIVVNGVVAGFPLSGVTTPLATPDHHRVQPGDRAGELQLHPERQRGAPDGERQQQPV